MKNLNTQLIILLAAMSLMGVGCAKGTSTSDNSAAGVTPLDPTGVTPVDPPAGADGTTTTNEVPFSPVSLYEMNSYVGVRPLNNPTDVKLKVTLKDVGGGKYAGDIKISYTDNGYRYEGNFYTCLTSNCINQKYDSYGTSKDNGASEAKYNYWFTKAGKKVFSGFFQDNYGAVMLVIDNVVDQGDGQGGSVVSGQIWYRNFATTFAPQSQVRACWFLYAGPYDCRSNIGMTKSALYPNDSYRKLGDFSGLNFTN
jgi:hypothetical protein